MKTRPRNIRKFLVAGGALCTALVLPAIVSAPVAGGLAFIPSVHAANEGAGAGGGGQGGQKGQGGSSVSGGQGGKGSSVDRKVFRTLVDDDSDRPDWAGVKGGKAGGGGKPVGAGDKKGDLYGDMVLLLRDENGEPILDDNDLVQAIAFIYDDSMNFVPLLDADGNPVVIPRNDEGDLLTEITLDGTTYEVYPAEVDLGRLSVSRSPTKVLEHSLDEALSKLTSGVVTLDPTGRLVVDGVTIDSPLENLALYTTYMTTGAIGDITLPDGFNPAALLAAAGDKTGTILVDTVIYINSILGINSGTEYYDFSTYQYDREDTWGDVTVNVLVLQPDGVTYKEETVDVYDILFGGTDWVDTTDGGADDFAAAANDYLQVIEFVHDNEVR